jgi:3-oxoacyl-[acyl-carrier-protein] synthase III
MQSVIRGCGGYLPPHIVTNHELSKTMDTTDEWITSRVGVNQRHWVGPDQFCSDLATEAAKAALKNAGMQADEIDLIIVGTTTPDRTFPAVAVMVQDNLGIRSGAAFDIQAVCSGFVYGLTIADSMLKSGQAKRALVIGAETMSKIIDPEDRTTAVIFGDGAGAMILEAQETTDRGILSCHLYSDGQFKDYLYVDGGPGHGPQVGHIRMRGKEVMRHAIEKIGQSVEDALNKLKLTVDDIDWFVPHQANYRIIKGISHHFGIPMEKMVVTIDRHANTSAASIPLAMAEAVSDGRIKPGHLVICEALGGGFTWGSAVMRW